MPAPLFSRRHGMRAAAAAALALPLATQPEARADTASDGSAVPVDGSQLHAMTFNLRYASDTAPNSWPQRRPVMRELLRRAAPHLLGTQEGLYGQLRDIAADLGPHYDWLGTGRAGGSRDEFMAVFYDTRRLEPLEYDHFWLSDTPYVIGSNTWGGAVVRMVTWVRFQDRATDRQFYALNTHLDHISQYARERAAGLINARLAGLNPALPRIVTGDFNVAAHGNPVYDTLLGAAPWPTHGTPPTGAASCTRPSTATNRWSPTATASTGSSPHRASAPATPRSTPTHPAASSPVTTSRCTPCWSCEPGPPPAACRASGGGRRFLLREPSGAVPQEEFHDRYRDTGADDRQ